MMVMKNKNTDFFVNENPFYLYLYILSWRLVPYWQHAVGITSSKLEFVQQLFSQKYFCLFGSQHFNEKSTGNNWGHVFFFYCSLWLKCKLVGLAVNKMNCNIKIKRTVNIKLACDHKWPGFYAVLLINSKLSSLAMRRFCILFQYL